MKTVFPSSGFGDEAGPTLQDQIGAITSNGLGGLDVRSLEGKNVLDLSDAELDSIREGCEAAGIRVQAVGSPVNKVPLSYTTSETEMARMKRAIHAAQRLGTSRIRIFSPAVPAHQEDAAWTEIEPILKEQIALAQEAGVVLLHENDARYFGAFPEGAKQMFGELGGDHFKAAFDFANTVLIGFKPLDDWFPWLLPYLDTLHIKDSKDGEVVAAGEGEGQIVETLKFLIGQGWVGPMTLEPHLQSAGPLGGFSGPELLGYAAKKMREVAERAGGELGR